MNNTCKILILVSLIVLLILVGTIVYFCIIKKDNFNNFNNDNFIIYITHYLPLKERKQNIIKQLFNKFNHIFIENEPDVNFINKFDTNKLSKGEISLFFKHIECYKLISKNDKLYNLILEDDVILENNFKYYINKAIKELNNNKNYIIYIGNCQNLHIEKNKIKKDKFLYKHYMSKCTDSYIIDKFTANKFLDYFYNYNKEKITKPIDVWMNDIIKHFNLNVYWLEPTIIRQGSESGKFKSSLR
jgi:GR25 family glycosyltransferase involved in LPS biosynthesis